MDQVLPNSAAETSEAESHLTRRSLLGPENVTIEMFSGAAAKESPMRIGAFEPEEIAHVACLLGTENALHFG